VLFRSPKTLFPKLTIVKNTYGQDETSAEINRVSFARDADKFDLIVMQADSPRRKTLEELWGDVFRVLARSSEGRYVAYMRTGQTGLSSD